MDDAFRDEMVAGYRLDEPAVVLGAPIIGDEILPEARVQIALSARKARERAARAAERQRQKTLETTIRTAGRVVTSRAGQSLLRGVFGTIFGTGKR